MTRLAKKIYLFANWKMYLNYDESRALARELKKAASDLPKQATVAVFPSALAMTTVKEEIAGSPIMLGAQNTYWVDRGGYTGEVSATMYKAVGAEYALVGHSERRNIFNESNHDVRQKIEALLASGMTPVVCVGETLKERNDGLAGEVVEAQMRAAFTGLTWPAGRALIIAYEPVWAVGTGEACAPEEAARICGLLKQWVASLLENTTPVFLYGGSVRSENVSEFLAQTDINGILVGGASTKADSWQDIVTASLK